MMNLSMPGYNRESSFKERLLPLHQAVIPLVADQRDQERAAGYEGGIHLQPVGDLVPTAFQVIESLVLGVSESPGLLDAGMGIVGGVLAKSFRHNLQQGLPPMIRPALGKARLQGGAFDGAGGQCHEAIVAENKKRGLAMENGFLFAPMPSGAKDSEGCGGQPVAAWETPNLVGITRSGMRAFPDQPGAGLAMPLKPSQHDQLLPEQFGQRMEVSGVVEGVIEHRWSKGTPGPVGLLGAFHQSNSKKPAHKIDQAEFFQAKKPGSQHGIEDVLGNKAVRPVQQAQIIVRPVKDQLAACQNPQESFQFQGSQRIHEGLSRRIAQLDQTKLFRIAVNAIGLGIHRNPLSLP